jgi:hypothetical protein
MSILEGEVRDGGFEIASGQCLPLTLQLRGGATIVLRHPTGAYPSFRYRPRGELIFREMPISGKGDTPRSSSV